MSVFRSRLSSIRLKPGSGEWTPLIVAVVLLGGLGLQFALPIRTTLPDDSMLAPRRQRTLVITMVPEYGAVLHAPIFAPDRAPGEAAGAAGADATASFQVLGLATSGGIARAVVKGGDGATHVLAPGQDLQGWRLLSTSASAAVFLTPAGRVSLPLGGPPPKAPGNPPGSSPASEPQS